MAEKKQTVIGKKKRLNQSLLLAIMIIVLIIIATLVNPRFIRITNLINILQQVSILGIIACGVGMLLISGEIDISVGSMVSLMGIILAMIFQKPSLRTRVSFETGMTQLGGHAIYLSPTDISLGKRETTEDIAIVPSRYVDIIMARVFGHDIVEDLAKHATVPVINGLSDFEHPCQAMADMQTILERKDRLEGLTLCYIGDGNNVAHSLMLGAAQVGMHATVITPPGYEPQEKVTKLATEVDGQPADCELQPTPH